MINEIKNELQNYPGISVTATPKSITIVPECGNGFPIVVFEKWMHYLVYFGPVGKLFLKNSKEESLVKSFILFGLSDSCRIVKESSWSGSSVYHIEYFIIDDNQWVGEAKNPFKYKTFEATDKDYLKNNIIDTNSLGKIFFPINNEQKRSYIIKNIIFFYYFLWSISKHYGFAWAEVIIIFFYPIFILLFHLPIEIVNSYYDEKDPFEKPQEKLLNRSLLKNKLKVFGFWSIIFFAAVGANILFTSTEETLGQLIMFFPFIVLIIAIPFMIASNFTKNQNV